ncbi:MAG: hypothetical protein J6W52_07150, partial [Bacteroidaceae bacterium]|nr:hypothetical protein [Bacteroidaceae bacterium]
HFDGFFYDEVLKMSYSKTDTAGVEYDVFITQEIVTADSTYRIMLSAIDSVSFVQPEIIFNPKLIDMRKTGMVECVYAHSTDDNGYTTVGFALDFAPDGFRFPQEGDILVDFIENYGGHVTKVEEDKRNNALEVTLSPITSFKDIFEQFTTVEQYGTDMSGNLVRRRVAGVPELNIGEFPSNIDRKAESSAEMELFKFSLNRHFILYNDSVNNKSISIDVNTETPVTARASWNFTDRKYMGLTIKVKPSLQLGFTVDYKFKDIFPAGLGDYNCIWIPGIAPLFQVNLSPDAFLRGDCHATFNFQLPKLQGQFWFKLEYDGDKKDYWGWGMDFGVGTPPGEKEPNYLEESENNPWASGSLTFSGFVQTGIQQKFAFGTGKLLSWLIGSSVEAVTYIGPKLSGELKFALDTGMDMLSIYNLMKDSKLTFNPLAVDYESSAKVDTWLSGQQKVTLIDGSLGLLTGVYEMEAYLFPNFEMDVQMGKTAYGSWRTADVTVKPSRNVILPVEFGIGVYDHNNNLKDYTWCVAHGLPMYGLLERSWPKDAVLQKQFTLFDEGLYTIRPILNVGAFGVLAASPSYEVEGVYFRVNDKDVPPLIFDLANNPQPISFPVETNALRGVCSAANLYNTTIQNGIYTLSVNENAITNASKHQGWTADVKFGGVDNSGLKTMTQKSYFTLTMGDMRFEKIKVGGYLDVKPLTCEVTDASGNQAEGEILTRTCHGTSKGTDGDPDSGEGQLTWDITFDLSRKFLQRQGDKSFYLQDNLNGLAYIRNYSTHVIFGGRFTHRDFWTEKEIAEKTIEREILFEGQLEPGRKVKSIKETMSLVFKDGDTYSRTWIIPEEELPILGILHLE